MTSVTEVLEKVFVERGWSVEGHESLEAAGLGFDIIAESDSAVVFAKALAATDVSASIDELSSQVASMTLAEVSAKSWEAYLLLAVSGMNEVDAQGVQEVQHDLNYCRKIVIDIDDTLSSEDPVATLRERLSFLFPLDFMEGGYLSDVRAMLVETLASRGVSQELARDLVREFDAPDCRCLARLELEHMEIE